MPDNYERFVAAFLRLNGYFTVPNFIVHAGDDPSRISGGMVGNHTETDTIAIRMPYSAEVTGTLEIANYPPLVDGSRNRFDIVFAESKSGQNKPNRAWAHGHPEPAISYMVRFVGYHDEAHAGEVARQLARSCRYEDSASRYRYVIFASEENEHYATRGVTYITFRKAIEFLVSVRGTCWIEANIGVASVHHQWDDLLRRIFATANDQQASTEQRVSEIETLIAG